MTTVTGSVLIVDDNPTNLAVLKQALSSIGLKVRVETNGERAIEQVKQRPPDLLLLDVQMPGISGFETCRRLKADPTTCNIPILFMTALADAESKVFGLSLGAVDYITKPFEQEEVLARIKIHLQLCQLTRSLQQVNATLEQQVVERTQSLQQAQVQMIQQEKLSMLGELVAGVAHEINNPLGCIVSNLSPARNYAASLTHILRLYQQQFPDPGDQIRAEIQAADLEFILEDLPKLLNSLQVSANRIKEISISLRNFARSDTTTKTAINLHEGLESTLLILQHRLRAFGQRPQMEIVKDYGEIPLVEVHAGQLNQVFMNILANAIDAIEEKWQGDKNLNDIPKIVIQTRNLEKYIEIKIKDNGTGMNGDTKQKVFDQLFTTKPLGQGTGLGLTIAYQIIVDKHGGTLTVDSIEGEGTEFTITLPVTNPQSSEVNRLL